MVLAPPVGSRMRINAGEQGSRTTEIMAQPFGEFTRTIEGDSAVQETRILPERGRSASPAALRERILDRGRALCDDDFRVMHSQYFLPAEATSTLLGIPTPWLKVTYRCSVLKQEDLAARERDFAIAVANLSEWSFFDIHRHPFAASSSIVAEALRRVVDERGLEVIQETKADHATLIVTNTNRRGMWGFPTYEQVVAAVFDDGAGSELVFQFYVGRPAAAESPDINGLQSYNYHGITPLARDNAYEAAELLLGRIAGEVESLLDAD